MESLQFAFRHLLITDEQVSESVGDQIRPDKLAENDSLLLKPGILLTVPKFEDLPDLSGRSGPEFEATVEVACCAHTRRDAQRVEQLARTALEGFRGTAGGLFFEAMVYQHTKEEFEPPDDDSDSHDWYINVALFYVFGRR
ncbi:hypothetical protein [Planctomicrobium sp. SH527]|uniref:hypothetical protein n=1 Tax=Planctomicrobium sp. SH527 TaxID=3448123 RepID=UPI003F5B79AD